MLMSVSCAVGDDSLDTTGRYGPSRGWEDRSSSPSPSGRQGAALAGHNKSGAVALTGGGVRDPSGAWTAVYNDTWEWDGSTWVDVTAANGAHALPARAGHAMAYDPVRQQLVVFGGEDASGNLRGGTYTSDTVTWILGP